MKAHPSVFAGSIGGESIEIDVKLPSSRLSDDGGDNKSIGAAILLVFLDFFGFLRRLLLFPAPPADITPDITGIKLEMVFWTQ